MKKSSFSVARRYARALLEVAVETKAEPETAQELAEAAELLSLQSELAQALLHPALAVDKKKKVALAVWARSTPLLRRLLSLLIDRGRFALLPEIAAAYKELWNEHRGIVSAEAVSAVPLAASQQEALKAAARTLVGREVTLATAIDPTLVGGVVLRMSGRTYDGSIRSQLARLRAQVAASESTPAGRSGPRT